MVEEESKIKEATGRIYGGGRNLIKRGLEKLGFRIHYGRTSELLLVPTKDLQKYIKVLGTKLNKLMGKEGIEDYFPHIESKIAPKMRELYEKLQENYSMDVCERQRQLHFNGTCDVNKGEGVPIQLKVFNKVRNIIIPDTQEVKFPDGSRQNVCYYGYKNPELWIEMYEELLNEIFNDARKYYNDKWKNTKGDELDKTKEQLDILQQKYRLVLGSLLGGKGGDEGLLKFTSIYERDKDEETRYSNLKQQENAYARQLREEVMKRLPQDTVDFFYKRTYKIVMPYYWDGKEYVDLTEDELKIKKEYGEFEVGKDEYGMPFEVADENYVFDGEKIPEGTLLIDVFEGRPLRRVRKEFIGGVPLLELVAYVLNEWDETRDDWRDGRYHHNSLTITDYIMASNKALGGEWKTKWAPLRIKDKDREYKMELKGGWPSFENYRKSSDLNPAFDLRSIELKSGIGPKIKFMHFGKKRYYQTWEGLLRKYPGNKKKSAAHNKEMAEMYDPVITTRGLSMFIIDQICRRGKIVSEIHSDLLKVSEETGGFDYGPKSFGKPLNKDPFNVRYDKVNADLERLRGIVEELRKR